MQFLHTHADVIEQAGSLAVVREQFISKDFLDDLHSERMAKAGLRAGEHDRVASVPTSLVDLWINQGFDFWNASARDIVARLDAEGLNAFVTTDKAL